MNEEYSDGCVHIYCGDGKGKTSAAIGLAVRAAGSGMRVLVARFLKNDDSGEVAALRSVPGIVLLPCEKKFGFFSGMTDGQKKAAAEYFSQLFETACRQAEEEKYDVLILDEIAAVCNYGLVSEAAVTASIQQRPAWMELVLTGRNPAQEWKAAADYISVIRMEKHPYARGLAARRGIEY